MTLDVSSSENVTRAPFRSALAVTSSMTGAVVSAAALPVGAGVVRWSSGVGVTVGVAVAVAVAVLALALAVADGVAGGGHRRSRHDDLTDHVLRGMDLAEVVVRPGAA